MLGESASHGETDAQDSRYIETGGGTVGPGLGRAWSHERDRGSDGTQNVLEMMAVKAAPSDHVLYHPRGPGDVTTVHMVSCTFDRTNKNFKNVKRSIQRHLHTNIPKRF